MRVLVVQTAFLGDIVLTTPLGAAVLAGHPFIDAVLPFDKRGRDRGALGTLRGMRSLRRLGFDAAVAAQRSGRTGLLVAASGARPRVGFHGAPGRFAYTESVRWDADRHAVHRYLALSAPLGGDPESADPTPVLAVDDVARARVHALLARQGIGVEDGVVAIAPGSIWGTKRWTPEGFAAVARAVLLRGLRPVLVGSPDEAALCTAIAERAGGSVPVLAGATGVADLTALLARSRALIVNDSGPGHVASAVGTPVVAIFGPTVPAFGYTPFGAAHRIVEHPDLPCRPCDRHGPQVCPLGHHRCMQEIGAERVLGALAEVLKAAD